ncbi:hypothetical protein BASA81_007089 [Batrachochytrium salamandrivorans]|nr:hypothetical protein BASA81_007089 [Batrachochytrium salamandrivorans]
MKHERRLHRDIKPQNILINSLGQVKLTDFGVSKELMNTVAMGKTYVGTFKYMAPERLMNQPHNFASDIYSLGIVLYELAVGRTPFADLGEESQINVCQIAVSEVIPTLPEGRFSPHFRDFVSRCISKQPGDRPAPEKLLGHPWLAQHAANSLGEATQNVRQWIASLQ